MQDHQADRSTPNVDGYSDLRLIGRGGFSVVYSAIQAGLGRQVALKVINASGSEARRFAREAAAAGTLSDIPHILPAFAVTTCADGRPVLIMPLMDRSLSQLVRSDGPVDIETATRWAEQLGSALDRAHSVGILHRDVKPDNVLLSSSAEVFLADFGIATHPEMSSSTTTSLSLSPPHAPPERFYGSDTPTAAGDVYSLASTLYTALAGHPPFGTAEVGGALGLMMRVANEPPPPIVTVTPAVNAVLAIGLAKRPTDRYPTPGAFAADLRRASGSAMTIGRVPSLDDLDATIARARSTPAPSTITGPPPVARAFDTGTPPPYTGPHAAVTGPPPWVPSDHSTVQRMVPGESSPTVLRVDGVPSVDEASSEPRRRHPMALVGAVALVLAVSAGVVTALTIGADDTSPRERAFGTTTDAPPTTTTTTTTPAAALAATAVQFTPIALANGATAAQHWALDPAAASFVSSIDVTNPSSVPIVTFVVDVLPESVVASAPVTFDPASPASLGPGPAVAWTLTVPAGGTVSVRSSFAPPQMPTSDLEAMRDATAASQAQWYELRRADFCALAGCAGGAGAPAVEVTPTTAARSATAAGTPKTTTPSATVGQLPTYPAVTPPATAAPATAAPATSPPATAPPVTAAPATTKPTPTTGPLSFP